jgi:hypothetical protein
MKRTYLALTGLALAIATIPSSLPPMVRAANVFDSQRLEASRFAVLAQPVADDDWTLVVLEQLAAEPRCWESREDGLVDPSLPRVDAKGICARYLDSNGYSLRMGGDDLGASHRLTVRQVGDEVQLQVFSPEQDTLLVLGRGKARGRDRSGFVPLQLEAGWELRRRVYDSQALNHVYISHEQSVDAFVARTQPTSGEESASEAPLTTTTPAASATRTRSRLDRALLVVEAEPTLTAQEREATTSEATTATTRVEGESEPQASDSQEADLSLPIGFGSGRQIAMQDGSASAIPLEVVPYRE